MKVKCIFNTGEGLSQKTLDMGYEKDSKFNIEIGKEYTVYSMIMWNDSLDYLIMGESSDFPTWLPSELFEVVNHLLPMIWYYTFDKYKNYKGQDSFKAVWGYKEMVSDSEHYISLEEGNREALEIFSKRKRQLDEFEELNQYSYKK